ncbi:MAG: feoB [Haloplasmataceae bacterium]|nr:feoB [Haloplasmataceae bacterium]
MRYLLIGNPNVGKSSVFNLLTNSYAHVGNYGGITVESKLGKFIHGEIIDLPGTYSVCPNSEDEGIVTYSLINEKYDGLIDIVDSTHLKRNLHLTIQLLELGVPTFIVANMTDELEYSGRKLDISKLSNYLKSPVIPISAKTKSGIEDLKSRLSKVVSSEALQLYYGNIIELAINKIMPIIDKLHLNPRFVAIQLLEGNTELFKNLEKGKQDEVKKIMSDTETEVIKSGTALSVKGAIFNTRREFIDKVVKESLLVTSNKNHKKLLNHKIDRIVTHPFFGLIIFLLVMFSIYFLTFDFLGTILSDYIDVFLTDYFSPFLKSLLLNMGLSETGIFMSLILDGIVAGVGGVVVFIPQMTILFLILAVIEGTGYMARVAIMLDTLLSKFGLNGKSIVPLVTGIGCNVPAIMATRTIADKKERNLTILITPFMSCSARIPVYALLASIFFEKHQALVIISMYVIGTIVALLAAKLLSLSIFKDKANNFILEIPPYRIPAFKNVYRHTKMMVKDFIEKAGKFILLGTVVLWFLQYLGPNGSNVNPEESFLALIGNFFAPLFIPLGFGSWEASSSLVVGFLAKELIYSNMIVIYGGESAISGVFNPVSAYSFMVFSLLYLPCLATVGTIHQETKSTKFTLITLLFTFTVAYIVTLIIYNIGNLLF